MVGRRAQQLDERCLRPVADVEELAAGEDALEPCDGVVVARALRQDAVVDQLAQGTDRRVLVADAGQQKLLELDDRWLAGRSDAGKRRREPVQEPIEVVAQSAPDVAHRGRHRRSARRLARDQEVTDLMQQPERPDLAGRHAGRLGRPLLVHALGERPDGIQIGDRDVAADAEQGVVDAVALAGGPSDVEIAPGDHRRRMARAGWHRQPAGASAGRSAATCSIARRRSSRPAGSNS